MYEVPPGSRFVVVDKDAILVPLGFNVQLFGMVQSGTFCPLLVERVTSPVGIPLLPCTVTFTTTEEP
jgi:hypothetical protein